MEIFDPAKSRPTFAPTAGTLYRIALVGSTSAAYTLTGSENGRSADSITLEIPVITNGQHFLRLAARE